MVSARATTAILLTASLALCAPPTTTMTTASDVPALEGTAWTLADLPGLTLERDRPATLRFEGGRASGFDGCNRFTAAYTAKGAALEVAEPGASTMMACPPERMKLAQTLAAALGGTRSCRVDGGRLVLLGADGQALATFHAQSTELAGTSWTATAINNGKQAVASVVKDSTVTLEFVADGKAAGSAGCNRYSTTYAADGSKLTFGPAASTRMMCPRPEVMEQEQSFLEALETVATARLDGDGLELRTATGALAVSLTRSSGP